MKEKYVYYIEDQGDQFIAEVIRKNTRPSDKFENLVFPDGQKHTVYVCYPALLIKLRNLARQSGSLRYQLYRVEGMSGKAEPCALDDTDPNRREENAAAPVQ